MIIHGFSFFKQLKYVVGERESICVVSDCKESIIKVVSIVYPKVQHLATFDIYERMYAQTSKRAKIELVKFSMLRLRHTKEIILSFFFNKVGMVDQRVKSYLENDGFEKWAWVYAPVNRGRMMTSNITECINKKLKEARELPIIDFVEQTK